MPKTVVLTGVGHDQVGIVAEVTQKLFDFGCNLLDSSMTLLRGEFAIILMLELAENQSVDDLRLRLSDVENKMGLTITVRELSASEIADKHDAGTPHMISVYGADKPGIVAGITKKLAKLGVNITDVETKASSEGKKTIFVMILEVSVPKEMSTQDLEEGLADISKSLNVDVTVQSVEVLEL